MNLYNLESFRYLKSYALNKGLGSGEELSSVLLELWREFEQSYPHFPEVERIRDDLAPLGVTRLERKTSEGYWWWEPQRNLTGLGGWFFLSAAHFLPNVEETHKCRRLHGHRFRIKFEIELLEETNSLSQLARFHGLVRELLQPYQRRLLNEISGLENPTAENLAACLFNRGEEMKMGMEGVEVWETSYSGCGYKGEDHYQGYKDFELECALANRHSYEGRSLYLRLGIETELDQAKGWTMDFARIKELFRPCYQRLDHRNLSSIEGEDLSNLEDLATWILEKTPKQLPLGFLQIEEEPGRGIFMEV
jgi:6-pyruvoyltetrahydropterin/6-carboxytetrahydropterin synthase